eukprot:gene10352-2766_t
MSVFVGLVEVVFLFLFLYIINLLNPNIIKSFFDYTNEIKNEFINLPNELLNTYKKRTKNILNEKEIKKEEEIKEEEQENQVEEEQENTQLPLQLFTNPIKEEEEEEKEKPEEELKDDKKRFIDVQTQVREIDFVTMQYRTTQRIRKVESKYFQEQMELPVLLKGDIWSSMIKPITRNISTQTRKVDILSNGSGSDEEYQSAKEEIEDEEDQNEDEEFNDLKNDIVKRNLSVPKKIEENLQLKRKKISLENEMNMESNVKSNLEKISMSDIFSISNLKSFYGLKQIIKFIISEKSIKINENILEKITKEGAKETRFSFKSNGLVEFPIEILDINDRVTQLDLSYNFIVTIPNWFSSNFEYLTHLDLSHNFLFELPNSFSQLQKLKELNLSNNKFEFFPDSILDLNSLQSLNLKYNKLTYIPSEILKLKKTLTELDLSNNNLIDIPEEFKQFKKFKYIDLEKNFFLYKNHQFLESLPEEIKKKKIASGFYKTTSSDFTFDSTSIYKNVKFEVNKKKSSHLLEFLINERKYVENLNLFNDIYFKPIRNLINTENDLISIEDINLILPKEYENIIEFSRGLLITLIERISILEHYVEHNETLISDIFIMRKKFFENHFVTYIHFYQNSIQALSDLEKKNPEFLKYLNQRKKIPACGGKSLQNFLSLPLNRLQKYFNFFVNLLNVTPQGDNDFFSLNNCVILMSDLLSQQKTEFERINFETQLTELEKLSGMTLRKPGRNLIHSGKIKLIPNLEVESILSDLKGHNLKDISKLNFRNMKGLKLDEHPTIRNLMSKNIYDVRIKESIATVYLLTDIMVITEPTNVKNSITLYNLYHGELIPNSENDKTFTVVLENNQRFIFSTKTKEEKQNWISKFDEILDFLNTDDSLTTSQSIDQEEEDYDTLSVDDQTLVFFNNDGKSFEATKGSDRSKVESIFKRAKRKIQKIPDDNSSPKLQNSNNSFSPNLSSSVDKPILKIFASETDSDTELPDILKKKFTEEIIVSDFQSIDEGKDYSFSIQFKNSNEPKKIKKYSELIIFHDILKELDSSISLLLPLKDSNDFKKDVENYLKICNSNLEIRSSNEFRNFTGQPILAEKKKSPRLDKKNFSHTIIIKKPYKVCMDIIKDFENYPKYIKHLSSAKIVKQNNDTGVYDVEYVFKVGVVKIGYTLRHTTDDFMIMWSCLSGFIKNSVGSWIFEPIENDTATKVTYSVNLQLSNSSLTNFSEKLIASVLLGQETINSLNSFKKVIEEK